MFRALWLLPQSLWRAIQILRSPNSGFGHRDWWVFQSTQWYCAAWLLRIPRVIVGAQCYAGTGESNIGARGQLAFFWHLRRARSFFPSSKVRVIGTPIREAFLLDHPPALPERGEASFEFLEEAKEHRRLIQLCLKRWNDQPLIETSVTMTHQTGPKDCERIRQGYEQGLG